MPTVLCIDDSREGLATRKLFLELKGYSVLTATDGQTGLDLIASVQIDAVILDYRMPGLSGESVAREIKSRWPRVPIVMLSGYPEVPKSAKDLSDAFVVKGTHPNVLLSELERLIGFQPVPNATITAERSRKKVA
jgi:two-component system, OmpR family, alkaline phosphatase synthesis response regulator PhoP